MGLIFFFLGIVLWAWSIGCMVYAFYGFSKAQGDLQQQAASLIMGLGGALYFFGHRVGALPGLLLMLVGNLMAFNLLPLDWLNAITSGAEGEPRPGLGAALMLASLPVLAIGSRSFWFPVLIALFTDTTPPTSYLVVSLLGLALGGGMFYVGSSLARLREQPVAIRWPAVGAAILAASWYGLYMAPTFARYARRHADEQMAAQKAFSNSGSDASAGNAAPGGFVSSPAPVATVVLASSDGAFALELPSGWQPTTEGGTILAASRNTAAISISATGGPTTQESLRRLMQRSQKKTTAQGGSLEGKLEAAMLAPGQPLVFYRCKFKNVAYLVGGFTIGRHSYSLVFKNLSDAERDSVGRSLTRSAQTAAGGGPRKP